MKYYKLENEVYAYESDGSQDSYIKPESVLMTEAEVEEHLRVEEIPLEQTLIPLTRRQFKLALLHARLTDDIEVAIESVEDLLTKAVLKIEYTEATEFRRTSDSILYIANLLNLSDSEINDLWLNALTL